MSENIDLWKRKKRNYLVLEPNHHTTKFFSENLLSIEMKTTHRLMNKALFLGLSILELDQIVMYKFWYDYVKLKYEEKVKLFYMDTNSFFVNYLMVYCKTDDNYHTLLKMLRQNSALLIMN